MKSRQIEVVIRVCVWACACNYVTTFHFVMEIWLCPVREKQQTLDKCWNDIACSTLTCKQPLRTCVGRLIKTHKMFWGMCGYNVPWITWNLKLLPSFEPCIPQRFTTFCSHSCNFSKPKYWPWEMNRDRTTNLLNGYVYNWAVSSLGLLLIHYDGFPSYLQKTGDYLRNPVITQYCTLNWKQTFKWEENAK